MGVRKMNQWIEIAEQEFVPVYHRYWTIVNKVDTIYKEKVPSTAA